MIVSTNKKWENKYEITLNMFAWKNCTSLTKTVSVWVKEREKSHSEETEVEGKQA